MVFMVSAVDVADAGDLVRRVDFPAMQEGPLYRLMFPESSNLAEDQREAIVQWHITGLQEALIQEQQNFRQIRTHEGIPVGFCGWTLDHAQPSKPPPVRPQLPPQEAPVPDTLKVHAWLEVSANIRVQRERALSGLQNVCRKFLHYKLLP